MYNTNMHYKYSTTDINIFCTLNIAAKQYATNGIETNKQT